MTLQLDEAKESNATMASEAVGEEGRPKRRQRGAALLYLIGAMVVMASLASGVVLLTSGSVVTELAENRHMRAYYLAVGAKNVWQLLAQSTNPATYTIGSNKFKLSYSGSVSAGYVVSSVGTVNSGTSFESNFQVVSKVLANELITLEKGWANDHPENKNYSITLFSKSQSGAPSGYDATEWAAEYAANVNKYGGSTWLRLSDDMTDSNGAIWYTGYRGICPGKVCPAGACYAGKCNLGNGLRAVFSFKFNHTDTSSNSKDYADVMAFAIMTAATNDPTTAAGGPRSTDDSLGEYLGYAGMGINNVGIKPPKIGIEVDTYPNGCGDTYDWWWRPQSDSRCDNSNKNHVAVVFWGSRTSDPYYADDNRHGAGGTSDDPINPKYRASVSSGAGCGYYEKSRSGGVNWLEDNQVHTMRVEIIRSTDLDTSVGSYEIKVWVVDGQPASTDAFMDVTTDYTASSYSALLDYSVSLSASDNLLLNNIYFGWTEGTGGSTQNVDVFGLSLDFRE